MLFVSFDTQAEILSAMCEGEEGIMSIRDINPDGKQKNNLSDMGLYAHAMPDYDGKVHFTLTGLPKFEDYPPESYKPEKIASSIDWGSYPDARAYRTRLTEGLDWIRNNPSRGLIGGKYATVMHGCGTSCQMYWIINLETGKVLGTINTNRGLQYRSDSRLLIANMYVDKNDTKILPVVDEYYDHRPEIGYYEIKNDELSLFKLICTPSPWKLTKAENRKNLEENIKKEISAKPKASTLEDLDAQTRASIDAQNKEASINLTGGSTIEEQRQLESVAELRVSDTTRLIIILSIILATVIDFPSILTVLVSWKSKSVTKVIYASIVSTLLGEVINTLTQPTYDLFEIFFYRLSGQLIVGLSIYYFLKISSKVCISDSSIIPYKENNNIDVSNQTVTEKKEESTAELKVDKEGIVESLEKNNFSMFLSDIKNTMSFSFLWSKRTILEKAYSCLFILVIIALFPMPYEFYAGFRVAICIGLYFYIRAILSNEVTHTKWFWTIIGLFIVYNPLVPIKIGDQAIWTVINFLTIYILYRARLVFDKKEV